MPKKRQGEEIGAHARGVHSDVAKRAEMAVIGAVIHDASVVNELTTLLSPEQFGDAACSTVWRICQDLHRAGQQITTNAIYSHIAELPMEERLKNFPSIIRP